MRRYVVLDVIQPLQASCCAASLSSAACFRRSSRRNLECSAIAVDFTWHYSVWMSCAFLSWFHGARDIRGAAVEYMTPSSSHRHQQIRTLWIISVMIMNNSNPHLGHISVTKHGRSVEARRCHNRSIRLCTRCITLLRRISQTLSSCVSRSPRFSFRLSSNCFRFSSARCCACFAEIWRRYVTCHTFEPEGISVAEKHCELYNNPLYCT